MQNEGKAFEVFKLQCNFYNDKQKAFESLSADYQDIISSKYPNLAKKKRNKAKARYYSLCLGITEQNAKYILEINKRQFRKYDIDHIVPISYGYKHNIPPHLIGSIENIHIISHLENTLKGRKLIHNAIVLIERWKRENKI
jgi:hypothetical protein